jgi:hypothetical protein
MTDDDLYLGWRNDVTCTFRTVSFNATFKQFANRLSDSLLINIRFCAHALDKCMPEKNIARGDLDAIRASEWSLYENVLKSDLQHHLSRYLHDYLYLMIEPIDDYDITGGAGIERSLKAVIGAVATDTSTAKQAIESSFGERFWGVMTKVGVTLQIAKTAAELAQGVQKFLPHAH